MTKRMTLAKVIAENVRRLRTEAKLTQEQLAERVRLEHNLDWNRASVAWIETGESEPPLSGLLVLAAALRVRPRDLLVATGKVAIASEAEVAGADLPNVLTRGLPRPRPRARKRVDWRGLIIRAASAGEAERYFARRHGLDPEDVARLAFDLWNRSLSEERDRLAGGPDAPTMKKSHATRKLQVELLNAARKEGLLR